MQIIVTQETESDSISFENWYRETTHELNINSADFQEMSESDSSLESTVTMSANDRDNPHQQLKESKALLQKRDKETQKLLQNLKFLETKIGNVASRLVQDHQNTVRKLNEENSNLQEEVRSQRVEILEIENKRKHLEDLLYRIGETTVSQQSVRKSVRAQSLNISKLVDEQGRALQRELEQQNTSSGEQMHTDREMTEKAVDIAMAKDSEISELKHMLKEKDEELNAVWLQFESLMESKRVTFGDVWNGSGHQQSKLFQRFDPLLGDTLDLYDGGVFTQSGNVVFSRAFNVRNPMDILGDTTDLEDNGIFKHNGVGNFKIKSESHQKDTLQRDNQHDNAKDEEIKRLKAMLEWEQETSKRNEHDLGMFMEEERMRLEVLLSAQDTELRRMNAMLREKGIETKAQTNWSQISSTSDIEFEYCTLSQQSMECSVLDLDVDEKTAERAVLVARDQKVQGENVEIQQKQRMIETQQLLLVLGTQFHHAEMEKLKDALQETSKEAQELREQVSIMDIELSEYRMRLSHEGGPGSVEGIVLQEENKASLLLEMAEKEETISALRIQIFGMKELQQRLLHKVKQRDTEVEGLEKHYRRLKEGNDRLNEELHKTQNLNDEQILHLQREIQIQSEEIAEFLDREITKTQLIEAQKMELLELKGKDQEIAPLIEILREEVDQMLGEFEDVVADEQMEMIDGSEAIPRVSSMDWASVLELERGSFGSKAEIEWITGDVQNVHQRVSAILDIQSEHEAVVQKQKMEINRLNAGITRRVSSQILEYGKMGLSGIYSTVVGGNEGEAELRASAFEKEGEIHMLYLRIADAEQQITGLTEAKTHHAILVEKQKMEIKRLEAALDHSEVELKAMMKAHGQRTRSERQATDSKRRKIMSRMTKELKSMRNEIMRKEQIIAEQQEQLNQMQQTFHAEKDTFNSAMNEHTQALNALKFHIGNANIGSTHPNPINVEQIRREEEISEKLFNLSRAKDNEIERLNQRLMVALGTKFQRLNADVEDQLSSSNNGTEIDYMDSNDVGGTGKIDTLVAMVNRNTSMKTNEQGAEKLNRKLSEFVKNTQDSDKSNGNKVGFLEVMKTNIDRNSLLHATKVNKAETVADAENVIRL